MLRDPLRDQRATYPQRSDTVAGQCAALPRVGRVVDAVVPMPTAPTQFVGVTVVAKANVYFDGKVVSHTILFADGTKKTLGLIYPGSFHFNTGAPERMEIIAGTCRVKVAGSSSAPNDYSAGQHFDVPGKSGFDIEVASGICEYICSFL